MIEVWNDLRVYPNDAYRSKSEYKVSMFTPLRDVLFILFLFTKSSAITPSRFNQEE